MNLIKYKTSKPKWKLIEEVVALLEKSLMPDAKVEHNVWLPVIGRSGKRQCDVVINNPLAWAISTENSSNDKFTIVFSSSSKESSGAIKTQPPDIHLSGIVLKAEISLVSGVNKQIM